MNKSTQRNEYCQFQSEQPWLDRQFHSDRKIIKPDELEDQMVNAPIDPDNEVLNRVWGSMIGLALGDALGASVEFRPHSYLLENPVNDLQSGGTWGLAKGQFTDDTSMALCLANSLIARKGFCPYDQLVRYKWWYKDGYMSSTGECFDIGAATRQSLITFTERQKAFGERHKIPLDQLDYLSDLDFLHEFEVDCGDKLAAGNGGLMRLAPVPLFFYRQPEIAVKYCGRSAVLTHGDDKARDACRYYGALIVAALNGDSREQLLDKQFYNTHITWFGGKGLHQDIVDIAQGSYQKAGGYDAGIRGKGYVVDALRAALWAFWSDEGSFEIGAVKAVNLGDDTDTTAAIYGQLAGACYGYQALPGKWREQVYAKRFIAVLSAWITYEGDRLDHAGHPDDTRWETTTAKPDPDYRRRRGTTHDPPKPVKDTIDVPAPIYRPKSSEHVDSQASSDRLYFLPGFKSPEDVAHWVANLGQGYEKYAQTLLKNNIDAYWLFHYVDRGKLEKFGVKDRNDQKKMLKAIEDLKEKCPPKYAKEK